MSPPSLPFQALSFQPGCEQLHWFMIIIISSLPTSPCALVTHRVHLLPGWALQLLDATCMEAVCWLGMMCTMCICIYCLGKGSLFTVECPNRNKWPHSQRRQVLMPCYKWDHHIIFEEDKLLTFLLGKRSWEVSEESLCSSLDVIYFLHISKGALVIRCLGNCNNFFSPKTFLNAITFFLQKPFWIKDSQFEFTFGCATFSPSCPISPCRAWNFK